MKANKTITTFLVASIVIINLISRLSPTNLDTENKNDDRVLQELFSASETLDDFRQLSIEKQDAENLVKELQKQIKAKEVKELLDRKISGSFDVSRISGVSAKQIDQLLAKSPMKGLGSAIYDAEHKYGVNAIFIVAVAKLESSLGENYLSRTKNNLFSLNAWGDTTAEINRRAYSYASKALAVKAFSSLIRVRYIERGNNTVEEISKIYCEIPLYWNDKITVLMQYYLDQIKK